MDESGGRVQGAGSASAVRDPGTADPGGGEPAAVRLLALQEPRQGPVNLPTILLVHSY